MTWIDSRPPLIALGAVALTCLALTSSNGLAAERVVLGEYFSYLGCPTCAAAGPVVDQIIDEYGLGGTHPTLAGTFAVVECHVWDAHQLPWGISRAQGFYSSLFSGTPCFIHDGMQDAWPIDSYETKFLARQAIPTPVTIEIGVEEISFKEYDVTVRACLEADAEAMSLRIYMVIVEDHTGYTWYERNSFRVAATTTDIGLTPGACVDVTEYLYVPPIVSHLNYKVVAWAQNQMASGPAEVHQAAIVDYPNFEPLGGPCQGDFDESDDVGFADLVTLLGAWGPCPPECPPDLDGDGDVGFLDLVTLLDAWGPCS